MSVSVVYHGEDIRYIDGKAYIKYIDPIVFNKEETGHSCAICWYMETKDPNYQKNLEHEKEISRKAKEKADALKKQFLNKKRK